MEGGKELTRRERKRQYNKRGGREGIESNEVK